MMRLNYDFFAKVYIATVTENKVLGDPCVMIGCFQISLPSVICNFDYKG
jgi:hypothetical protein